jgi:hypothetical protein
MTLIEDWWYRCNKRYVSADGGGSDIRVIESSGSKGFSNLEGIEVLLMLSSDDPVAIDVPDGRVVSKDGLAY